MKYRIYDSDGKFAGNGTMEIGGSGPSVPTHGSISIEISPGVWFSAITSEWIIPRLEKYAFTWKHQHDENLARYSK